MSTTLRKFLQVLYGKLWVEDVHAQVSASHGVGIGNGINVPARLSGKVMPEAIDVACPIHRLAAPGGAGGGQPSRFGIQLFK